MMSTPKPGDPTNFLGASDIHVWRGVLDGSRNTQSTTVEFESGWYQIDNYSRNGTTASFKLKSGPRVFNFKQPHCVYSAGGKLIYTTEQGNVTKTDKIIFHNTKVIGSSILGQLTIVGGTCLNVDNYKMEDEGRSSFEIVNDQGKNLLIASYIGNHTCYAGNAVVRQVIDGIEVPLDKLS